MKAIYILADEVFKVASPLQSQESKVGKAGRGILKGGLKVGSLSPLLHGPYTLRTPDNQRQNKQINKKLCVFQ